MRSLFGLSLAFILISVGLPPVMFFLCLWLGISGTVLALVIGAAFLGGAFALSLLQTPIARLCRLKRLRGRENLSSDRFYDAFYGDSGFDRRRVAKALEVVSDTLVLEQARKMGGR
jgi:hypothetical protein